MTQLRVCLFAFLASLLAAGPATAATSLEVLATEPAGESISLGRNQTFYLRIAYTSEEPVQIWARPYFQGREINAGSNPSRTYSGTGEALAWFFFLGEPGQQVDEIRLSAGDGSKDGTRVLTTLPVRITAGTQPAPEPAGPAWLTRLRAEDDRWQREDYERRMSEPVSVGDGLFFTGFMLAVIAVGIGGVVAALRSVRRWQGAWRIAAFAPLLIVAFVVVRIVVDTALDPTSHNLWPFEILYAGFKSLVLLGLIALARRIVVGRG